MFVQTMKPGGFIELEDSRSGTRMRVHFGGKVRVAQGEIQESGQIKVMVEAPRRVVIRTSRNMTPDQIKRKIDQE